MKTLVIYDSMFGNTEAIARTIAEASRATLIRVGNLKPTDFEGVGLLIVGSPTQAGRPTIAAQKVLISIPDIRNIKVAAFDTRSAMKWVKIFGFAANRIASRLQSAGGELVLPPEGFFVESKEGPLLKDELYRAKQWTQLLLSKIQ